MSFNSLQSSSDRISNRFDDMIRRLENAKVNLKQGQKKYHKDIWICEYQNLARLEEQLNKACPKVKYQSFMSLDNVALDSLEIDEQEKILLDEIRDLAFDCGVDLEYFPPLASCAKIDTFYNSVSASGLDKTSLKNMTDSYLKHCDILKDLVQNIPHIDYDTWFHLKKLEKEYLAHAIMNRYTMLNDRIKLEFPATVYQTFSIGEYQEAVKTVKAAEKKACNELAEIAKGLIKEQEQLRKQAEAKDLHAQKMTEILDARRKNAQKIKNVQVKARFRAVMRDLLRYHRLKNRTEPEFIDEAKQKALASFAERLRIQAAQYSLQREKEMAEQEELKRLQKLQELKDLKKNIEENKELVKQRNMVHLSRKQQMMDKLKRERELRESKIKAMIKPAKSAPQLNSTKNEEPAWDRLRRNSKYANVLPAEFYIAPSKLIGDEKVDSRTQRFLRILYRNELLDKVDMKHFGVSGRGSVGSQGSISEEKQGEEQKIG